MSKIWRTWGVFALLGVLALTLAVACDDDDDDDDDDVGTPVATSTETGTPDTDGDDDDAPGVSQLTANLTGTSDAAISGTATVLPGAGGSGIAVDLQVDGLSEGGHANHIHTGSCDAQGDVVVPLNDIVAEADQAATQMTEADGSIDDYATGHYVAIHESSTEDGVGEVIACGDLS